MIVSRNSTAKCPKEAITIFSEDPLSPMTERATPPANGGDNLTTTVVYTDGACIHNLNGYRRQQRVAACGTVTVAHATKAQGSHT
jgi:hypothetical protein